MRAVALLDTTYIPTVVDLPKPTIGEAAFLVRIHASSLNNFDILVAQGHLQGAMEYRFPVVLCSDFSGEIVEIGAKTADFAVGDRVFGVLTSPFLGNGALAEYVAVKNNGHMAKIPDGVSFADAGAIGIAGATALRCIEALNLDSTKTVLIVGASGGVGAIAVQYARATGARVIATARPGAGADFVKSFGASEVVDGHGDLEAQVRALVTNGVDAIAHLAGDPTALVQLLNVGGHIASPLGFGPDKNPSAILISAKPDLVMLERLVADIASKKIRVPITKTFTLDEVPAAISSFASGKLGKLSVRI